MCRDEGEVGVVLGSDARIDGTVRVRTASGVTHAALDLVDGVAAGDRVLVHLGFILAVVEDQ